MEETELVGVSQNIRKIKKVINQVADTELDILVCGETGVGKELVVRNLYQKSNRIDKPFIKVNCAALPDTLLESEMFGYDRGAFTGADRKLRGKFELANKGVLFLDEIGDMSLSLQSKLLHALQDRDFTPLGSEKSVKTDIWVIAATNHDLQNDIEKDRFRADLYHRLNTITINVEPLRHRPEDIPCLIDYYTRQYSSLQKGKKSQNISENTFEKLIAYHWPGNVRELQNVLRRLFIFGDNKENVDDMLQTSLSIQPDNGKKANNNTLPSIDFLGLLGGDREDLSDFSLKKIRKASTDLIEKKLITYVLEKTGWNRSQATKILKISYKTMLEKIKDLDIQERSKFNNLIT
jgi:transcriptional regulator with GAF, ATPase, and Fis domain